MVSIADRREHRDVFISHASEDKDGIARPLAEELLRRSRSVWFDEYELLLGDPLRQKIDEGLAESTIGVVILSHAFFAKPWPKHELDGLNARMMGGEKNVIVPIWHGLTERDLLRYSPLLAGLLAASSTEGVVALADQIERVLARRSNGAPERARRTGGKGAPADVPREAVRETADSGAEESAAASRLERDRRRAWRVSQRLGSARALARMAVGILGAAVLLSVAIWANGVSGTHASAFRAGHLVLADGSAWRTAGFQAPAGLALLAPVAVSAGSMRINTGIISKPSGVAAGLPSAMRASYGAPLSAGSITLALGHVRRYAWSSSHVHRPLLLIVIATGAGEIAVACRSAATLAARTVFAACLSIAGKLRLLGTRVEYPGADPVVGGAISRALEPRAKLKPKILATLRARRLTARATALGELVQIDVRAQSALGSIVATPRYTRQIAALVQALESEEAFVNGVAGAARHDQRARYASLSLDAHKVGRRLQLARRALVEKGFSVAPLQEIALPRLPTSAVHRAAVATQAAVAVAGGEAAAAVEQGPRPSEGAKPAHKAPEEILIVTKPK